MTGNPVIGPSTSAARNIAVPQREDHGRMMSDAVPLEQVMLQPAVERNIVLSDFPLLPSSPPGPDSHRDGRPMPPGLKLQPVPMTDPAPLTRNNEK